MQDEKKNAEDVIEELAGAEVEELEDGELEDVAGGRLDVLDDNENCNNTQCCS